MVGCCQFLTLLVIAASYLPCEAEVSCRRSPVSASRSDAAEKCSPSLRGFRSLHMPSAPNQLRLRGGSDASVDDDSPLLDEPSDMDVDSDIEKLPQVAPPVTVPSQIATKPNVVQSSAPSRSFTKPRTAHHQGTTFASKGQAQRNLDIRPPVSRPLNGPIAFQLLDVDYTRTPPPFLQNASHNQQFIVHAFGTTQEGNSVHVGLRGFLPYFFINITSAFTEEHCEDFIKAANKKMRERAPINSRNQDQTFIVKWERVQRKNILGYRRADSLFLKISCSSPETVRSVASFMRGWDAATETDGNGKQRFPWLGRGQRLVQTFESNVDPITRLSTDTNIVLSGWVQVEGGSYREATASDVGRSCCDLDLVADIRDLTPVEGKEDVAPFLIGSFDIECVPEGGRGFPDARKPLDRCVQIGTAVYRFGESAPCINVVMTLGAAEVEADCGVEIREFESEEALLMAWQGLVVHELDLDLLTGHNIFKFDLNYVAERAKVLRLPGFFMLGKLRGQATRIKSTERQSKAFGHNQFHYLPMTGRMQMDIYNLMTKNHKLSSYKLDSMAKVFLGDHKDDVSPKQIFEFQEKDARHRGIVAKYCAKDCELVYKLIARLDYLPQYLEMSKVTGVTMNDLNTRGQQIKVFTQIVREARASGFVLPDQPRSAPAAPGGGGDDVQYQGAFVLRPQRGIYQEPIATLDFASLYPSIIRGDNLSYETLVTDAAELDAGVPVSRIRVEHGTVYEAEVRICHGSTTAMGTLDDAQFVQLRARVEPGMKIIFGTHKKTDAIEGPAYEVAAVEGTAIQLAEAVTSVEGEVVVKKLKLLVAVDYSYVQHVEGILPRICKNLLTARKRAKKEMAMTDDAVRKGLLNGKQLALKVSCNSVYGFTGAGRGMLPCLPIASSVTAIGQQMIKTTKSTVEELYNATVIYGDTDSVMVNFHCGEGQEALARALEMGARAAKAVTSKFKPPNELEFEKVYMPYILYNKKRYAGQMYTRADRPDKIDIKGLQVVRRDNSQLARDILKSLINTMVAPISNEDQAAHPGLSKADVTRHKIKGVVHAYLDDLAENKFPLDKFVISQSIAKKDYDDKNSAGTKSASLGHVKLADRMERREPGTGPVTGDRVPFVVVKEAPHLKGVTDRTIAGVTYAAKDWPPRHERCEDPQYVREQNLTVDLEYYLCNQLKTPIASLLEPLFDDKTDELFAVGERKIKNKCSGNSVLTSFFKPVKHTPPAPAPAKSSSDPCPSSVTPPSSSTEKETSRSLPLDHFFRKRGPGPAAKPPAKHAAR